MESCLVSLRTARLAREKGANWVLTNGVIPMPTQESLQKWLRDEKGIIVYVVPNDTVLDAFHFKISNRLIPSSDLSRHYNTWEDALEAGIRTAIKNLK